MANFLSSHPRTKSLSAGPKVKSSKGIRQRLEAAMSVPEAPSSAGQPVASLKRIECRNTSFTYPGAAAPVLKDICLTVSRQEKIGLTGKRMRKNPHWPLLFHYLDYSGDILFNGQQLRDIDRSSLYHRTSYIAQTTYLFTDTPRQHLSE